MSERIYAKERSGQLTALEETPFTSEDLLQQLIAEHPELLDGEQISPGNPRRWLLVSREKGIAPSSSGSHVWAVDHLIIDQDAVPTLVEVKRGSNPQIRREIVGQLLEYAAHATTTWTAHEIRATFESQAEDPHAEIASLLQSQGDPDVENFWNDVSKNLAARQIRLLFVADAIPDPLARVVEFLNVQMSSVEVLAVEIKQFGDWSELILVPRVIGRLAPTKTRSTQKLARESFLAAFENDDAREFAVELLKTADKPGVLVYYGQTGLSIRVLRSDCPPFSVAWVYPIPGIGWMSTREFSFGTNMVNEGDCPKKIETILNKWKNQFDSDGFSSNVSGKAVHAWVVRHDVAPKHSSALIKRLDEFLKEVTVP